MNTEPENSVAPVPDGVDGQPSTLSPAITLESLQYQLRHAETHIVHLEQKCSDLSATVSRVDANMERFLSAIKQAATMAMNNPMAKAMMPKEMRNALKEMGIE